MQILLCKTFSYSYRLLSFLLLLSTIDINAQSYTVSQTGTYAIESDSPTNISISGDNVTQIPIGFNFTFFGVSYSNCFVGGDGLITFNDDAGNGWCCGQQIPDADAPNNLIAAVWTNMDETFGQYEVFGSAPYRRLVITLDLTDPCGTAYYGQVKLFETTNVIEIHTETWGQTQSPCGATTQGIENANGTEAIPVPGRNFNSDWTVSNGDNDFVSFTPNAGAPVTYLVSQAGTYNIEINDPTFFDLYQDQVTEIPIGFNFNFFGTAYSSCFVGGDGFVAFGGDPGSYCCGQLIPDVAPANNLIAAAWTNMDASNAHYEIFGDAPYRRFVITLDLRDVCDLTYYGQVKLYETTNVIEIHTQEWSDNNTPCNPTTQGLENADGTQAVIVPGRNFNTDWTVHNGDNDFVSFTPYTPANVIYIVDQPDIYNFETVSPNEVFVYENGLIEVPIGFDFSFFGTPYSTCHINQNGFISFGDDFSDGCCEGQLLPNVNGPNNLIAGCWMDATTDQCCDMGNAYDIVSYETIGDAPNRKFIVTYTLPENCGQYYHGQIKLLETSNIIELHTDHWREYNESCSNATQGIENIDGTAAYFLAGRNSNTDWQVMEGDNDVVRFTPSTSLPPGDAGVSDINDDPFCAGSQMMSVHIRNYGGNEIDSVDVNWEWDGVPQTPIHFIGNMPLGGGDSLVNLGLQTLTSGQTYTLKAWTSLPNGIGDENNTNDTLSASIHTGMTGTYTIGGSSPDYSTFTDAINDLKTNGFCDTVIMNVRPGTYTGQMVMLYFPGSSGKQVIFRAENGDSSSVVLQYSATVVNQDYVVRFDSAHDIVLEKMTINALGSAYARVIELKNYSNTNIIRHCAITGRNATATNTDRACIYSDSYDHHNTFENNTIKYGSYGFYHTYDSSAGSGSQPPDGLVFKRNIFSEFYNMAISTNDTKGQQIHYNTFQSTKSNVRAISITTETDTLSISNNMIYLTSGAAGISLDGINPTSNARVKIFNNFVNVPGNSSAVGMQLFNSNKLNIYHNNVRNSGTNYTVIHSSGIQDSIYNNIFANTGTGPVMYSGTTTQNSFDYNDLYATGPQFGEFLNAQNNAINLHQWQSFTGYDTHSLNVNPLFTSTTDLHVANNALNAVGNPVLSTALDIDGTARNTIHPDLGADEFIASADDAALTQLLSPTLICNPEQNIEVVLSNLGSDTLHNVTIKWTLNNIPQPDVNYTQIILPEGDTAHVILALHTFSNQVDTLKIWTSLPNGNADSQQMNDTISYRFRLPLSGVYTIGGANPDFSTFTKAVNDLNLFTTCGPVTFRFRDGIYEEQVVIDSIATASALNTITFESESGDSSAVTIQFTPNSNDNPSVIMLNGTDYITFRHLGIKVNPSFYSDVLELRHSAKHVTVSHCYLEGYYSGGSSILFKSLNFGGLNEYFNIDHNYFLGGLQAVFIFNNSGNGQHEIHIENNTFQNQRYEAIRIVNTNGLYIRRNNIHTNTTVNFTGINQNSANGYTEISGNNIILDNIGDGMFLNSINFGTNIGNGYVFNNMVSTAGSGSGIRLWNSEKVITGYNSCYARGSGNGFELVGGDSAYVRNNIFISNTGRAFSSFAYTPTVSCDYNDLYSISGDLGFWHDTLYPTFLQWKTGTGFDAHSITITPQFVSPTDLHILADTLDGAGNPIPGIAIDIDGNPRNANTPDIGADEIGANNNDAGVFTIFPKMPFSRGLHDVKAVIRNFGGNTITSAEIHWKVNNVVEGTFNYSGSLPTLQQDTVILGQVNFLLSTPYVLKSWTAQPNAVNDLYNVNDTITTAVLYPAVSDTLTIGGTSPDFLNFNEALTALSLGGVLDSVHFQIRNGIYHAVLNIPQTIGMNCTTPIIFESESGNQADVTWDNSSLTGTTLTLDGADGLSFRNLTIKTVQLPYHALEFKNGANCNSFINCLFEGMSTTSTSISQATVYSSTSPNTDDHFDGNTIKNGSYGIYWDGGANTTGSVIKNNHFQDAYYIGCNVANLVSPVIHKNIFTTSSAYNNFTALFVYSCNSNTAVTANQVLLPGRKGTGMLIYQCFGTSGSPMLIANNFIILGNAGSSYGIYHISGNYANVYNNTIRINGGDNTGTPYYRQYGTNFNLRNNIFQNEAGGYAMVFNGNYGPFSSDYNDFISTGANIVYSDGTMYLDLLSWQSTGQDANGMTEDPMYSSPTGYHITNAALNATAQHLVDVPLDIEDEVRDPLTPDIGCDEIQLFNNDVGILSINYPKEPFPSGINTVFIKFINNGQDTLTSMQVDWEVDGIPQPTYAWMGLLPSAGTYDSLDIGTYNFAPYQYHTIKAWVSLPNGNIDELVSNDTLQVNNLYPALLGTYTIGGSNPDFDSLKTAVAALNLGGAAGPVTFNIRTGTYLETLTITDYPGSDCDRPVTFQSETGDSTDVVITNLGINANTITLNGADGVIFKHLTLVSVNPAFSKVVNYFNGAHCNQFLNDHIDGFESTSTSIEDAVIYSSNTLDTANVFKNNWIEHGSMAFYLAGNGASANTLIQHNFLDHNYYTGIYGSSESGIKILDNTISGDGYTYYIGIYLEYCEGPVDIESNHVVATHAQYTIYLEGCIATAGSRGKIVNNFVSSGGATAVDGLIIDNSKYYDVFNNNVNVHSTGGSYAFYYHTDQFLNITNNIFSNKGAGDAVYGNNQTSLTSNHNDYYAVGSFGVWNGGDIANLAAWKTATGQDANSLNVNPQFVSDADLHISNILLNGTGQTLSYVTKDIDGDLRSSPPDIGADEFNPAIANDAGIFSYYGPTAPFASGSNPVKVVLKNYGYNTLTSADVRWLVNGIEQPIYHWTGSLLSAKDDTITVGNYTFAPHSDHDLVFWPESPNGIPDSTNVNDTLSVSGIFPALLGTYTVGGILPDFNLFSQVEDALNKGGILGNVTFEIRNGTYSSQFVIQNFPRINYNHQVVFESEGRDSSLVTITKDFYLPQNNYTVKFSNAHNIVLRDLTFGSNQGRVIDIADGSSVIHINNCHLTGPQLSYYNEVFPLMYSTSTTEDSLYIADNQFDFGDYGIFLTASWGNMEKNISILNNHFYNCYYRSIDVEFDDGLTVKGNIIYNDANQHEGMYILASANTKEISNNDIRLLHGGSNGIQMWNVSGNSSTSSSISNNYIFINNFSDFCIGISQNYGDYNNFYYNTVRLDNVNPSSIDFYDNSSNNHINLRNNNFANYSGGRAMYNLWYPGSNTNTMDYCNLYTTGPILARYSNEYSDLVALQAANAQNQHSVSAEPLFTSDDPDVFQAALNGSAVPISGITTDIDGATRNATTPDIGAKEFTLLNHNIGAKVLVSPHTYCGLSNAEAVTMRIQNYGSLSATGFDVAYSVNGSPWTIENVGSLTVSPGGTQDYTFTPTENLSQVGTYHFSIYTSLSSDQDIHNDTIWNIEVQHIPALVLPVSNMIPMNGEMDLEQTISLSWVPAPNANRYDIYIWPYGQDQPGTPQISDLTQINTLYNNLNYGTEYNWRVVAKNVCNQIVNSPVQQFSVRKLPDLVVTSVTSPPTAFSGQTIGLQWVVKNNGPGSTQSTLWSDAVYLSSDATLNTSFDTYLGAVQNLTALDSGIAYTSVDTFMVPQGFSGNYYIFIYADRWNSITETSNNNNWERTSAPMMISLTPAPDLTVLSVTTPTTVFSGATIPVTYVVKNDGLGGIPSSASWSDRILLGQDPLNAIGQSLGTVNRSFQLLPDSTYLVTQNVQMPAAISGTYYMHVITDVQNTVYEFSAEDNNSKGSLPINVVLAPPPDLLVSQITFPDTVSNNEIIPFGWTTMNQGAGVADSPYWIDNAYFSLSPVYNPNFLIPLTYAYKAGPVSPFSSYTVNPGMYTPENLSGFYFVYVYADRNNNVFENTSESNNILKAPTQIFVANADLIAANLSSPDTTLFGSSISLSWNTINAGPGKVVNRYPHFKIYLSSSATINTESVLLYQSTGVLMNLLPDDTIHRSVSIHMPSGITGNKYLVVQEDAYNVVNEGTNENNNVSSKLIFLQPGPAPDIITTSVSVPDTTTAGMVVEVAYHFTNLGNDTVSQNWIDKIYISFDSIWHPMNATEIQTINQSSGLLPGISRVTNLPIIIPQTTAENVYYIYIVNDQSSVVFEGTPGELNNIKRSHPVYIKAAPPIDLNLDNISVTAGSSIYTGVSYPFQWTTKNIGISTTLTNAWTDRIYLSTDTLLQPGTDILISEQSSTGTLLSPNQSRTRNQSLMIPNGLSGQYYIIGETDVLDVHHDVNRNNNTNLIRNVNGTPRLYTVLLSPYPDLTITMFNTPSTAIAGQPMQIIYMIANNGTGAASAWIDKMYLSSDNAINNLDLILLSNNRTFLAAGNMITDTVNVQVPVGYFGNYILILQTDANNQLYEHNAENNNILTRSINIINPPPSDLQVSTVIVPVSVIAGDNINISWTTKNIGINPASGVFREVVYISPDTLWNTDDVVFGVKDQSVYLSPAAQLDQHLTDNVTGVSTGDYYAIVQTDARNNFNESNENNNFTSSLDSMHVDVKNLFLDSLTADTLHNNLELYYKINVGPDLDGQTILLDLKGDSLVGLNELYVKYNQMPTRALFDYGFKNPFQANQRIIIPNVHPGTYYILAYGFTTDNTTQNITLFAKVIDYEILSLAPNHGVQNSQVTLKITGSKLSNTMLFRLRQSNPWFVRDAISSYIANDNLAFATFDLTGMAVDTYALDLIKLDSSLAFVDNFMIEPDGGQPQLQINAQLPGGVPGRNVPVQIILTFINNGDADVVNPSIRVEAPYGNMISMTLEDLQAGIGSPVMIVPLVEENGPPGVIRPGASGRIEIYANSAPSAVYGIRLNN